MGVLVFGGCRCREKPQSITVCEGLWGNVVGPSSAALCVWGDYCVVWVLRCAGIVAGVRPRTAPPRRGERGSGDPRHSAGLAGGGVDGAPAVYHAGHVGGDFGGEEHFFAGAGVDEAEGAGVEGLSGADFKTVFHEFLIA